MYISTSTTSSPSTSTPYWYPVYIANLALLIVYLFLLFFEKENQPFLFFFFLHGWEGPVSISRLVYTCLVWRMWQIKLDLLDYVTAYEYLNFKKKVDLSVKPNTSLDFTVKQYSL